MIACLKLLQHVFYIQYLVWFRNKQYKVKTLLNSDNKVNTLILASNLSFTPQITNVSAQIINDSLKSYKMVIAGFLVYNKLGRAWFFEEFFFLTNTSIEVVLKFSILFFSNANLQFDARKLTQKTYITAKVMPITRQRELIDKY